MRRRRQGSGHEREEGGKWVGCDILGAEPRRSGVGLDMVERGEARRSPSLIAQLQALTPRWDVGSFPREGTRGNGETG